MLQGIANLVAIGLERARAQELAHEIEATRRSEQLRTTIIDAMAHEFKTPLTSIRATTTMTEMENVLRKLKEVGIKSFTMVGGAVVTQDYADEIGADLYAGDALEAVARIKKLLGK